MWKPLLTGTVLKARVIARFDAVGQLFTRVRYPLDEFRARVNRIEGEREPARNRPFG